MVKLRVGQSVNLGLNTVVWLQTRCFSSEFCKQLREFWNEKLNDQGKSRAFRDWGTVDGGLGEWREAPGLWGRGVGCALKVRVIAWKACSCFIISAVQQAWGPLSDGILGPVAQALSRVVQSVCEHKEERTFWNAFHGKVKSWDYWFGQSWTVWSLFLPPWALYISPLRSFWSHRYLPAFFLSV